MTKIICRIQAAILLAGCIFSIPASAFTGKIALTFDDAPTADSAIMTGDERTSKIIDTLKQHNISDVLFFIKAENINPQTLNRLKKYSASSFHLANHSYSHQSANEISTNDFLTDAYRAHLLLKDLDNFLPYFRFPYLHYGKDMEAINILQKKLAALGYKDGFVTVDNADWYINSLLVKAAEEKKTINYNKAGALYVKTMWDAIVFFDEIAHKTYGRSPKHILLLHENDTTALFLGDLIKHIKKNGGEIISPQEAFEDPAYTQFPLHPFQKQGRVAAMAASQGIPPGQLKHPAENPEFIDAQFTKNKIIK